MIAGVSLPDLRIYLQNVGTLNGVYTRISEYGGRDTFEDGGQWTIDEKGVVTMTPAVKGGQPSLARVEEGAVRLLNADGDAVEGPMADLYVLKKDQ